MSRNCYSQIRNLGNVEELPVNNPLSYIYGNPGEIAFLHGSSAQILNGKSSKASQRYMAQYCAEGWDDFCEVLSKDNKKYLPNQMRGFSVDELTEGEILVANTARHKYLKQMLNGKLNYELYDPNVPSSPVISYWSCSGGTCVPIYRVDPKTIDNDPVMNKLLDKLSIAPDVLINIYNTAKREGTLENLKGTRLGKYFDTL